MMFRKKSLLTLIFTATSLLLITACSCTQTPKGEGPSPTTPPSTESPAEDAPVVFQSPLLEALIQEELGKKEIHESDLLAIKGFALAADEFIFLSGDGRPEKSIIHFYEDEFEYENVRYKGYGTLDSLADLTYFKNLTKLYITLQPHLDLSSIPTEILENLHTVFLYQSQYEDISFLSEAKALTNLVMNTNAIQDLSPLQTLTSLRRLSVDWNQVENLTPLGNLANLTYFSAYGNQVKDLTPLGNLMNLEELRLYENQVEDISVLKNLTHLKHLEMINNRIQDVSPLADFESFDVLMLSGNPITNIELLEHIESLQFEP